VGLRRCRSASGSEGWPQLPASCRDRPATRGAAAASAGCGPATLDPSPSERCPPVTVTDNPVPSRVIDVSDVPLSAEVNIDGLEYIGIMRRIGIQDGEAVTPVSAFNSSI